jgi:hypothetical protein
VLCKLASDKLEGGVDSRTIQVPVKVPKKSCSRNLARLEIPLSENTVSQELGLTAVTAGWDNCSHEDTSPSNPRVGGAFED